jgi:No apical meristem-associated C-terminal domain
MQLKNRFTRHIQPNCFLFNKYYKRVADNPPSGEGTTPERILELAMKEWKATEGKDFQWAHCLLILQQVPKWDTNSAMDKAEAGPACCDSTPPTNRNAVGSVMGSNLTRPIGCKAAKALEKGKFQSGRRVGDGFDRLVRATEADSAFNRMRELMRLYTVNGQHSKAEEMMKRMEASIGEVEVKIEREDERPSTDHAPPLSVVDVDLDVTLEDPSTLDDPSARSKAVASIASVLTQATIVSVDLLKDTTDEDSSSIESKSLMTPSGLSGAGHNLNKRKTPPHPSLYGKDPRSFLEFLSNCTPAQSAVYSHMPISEVLAAFKKNG